MICPFRYIFKDGSSTFSECKESDCMAWNEELGKCVLILPFEELAKEIKNEAEQDE